MTGQDMKSDRRRKAHVVEERWSVGGFHRMRYLRCRCGWKAEHYNSGHLAELFKAHQVEQEAKEAR